MIDCLQLGQLNDYGDGKYDENDNDDGECDDGDVENWPMIGCLQVGHLVSFGRQLEQTGWPDKHWKEIMKIKWK